MSRVAARRDASAPVAGLTTATAWGALARLAGASARWQRRNYRDQPVTLLLGPAVAAGALAGVAVAGPAARRSALLPVAAAAVVGAYDDLCGDEHARGLRGHLAALRAGRVTTGMVKLVTIGAAAAVSASRRHRHPVDAVAATVLVAGGANLVNLLDLRPGRAAKVSLLAGTLLRRDRDPAAAAVAGAAVTCALAALPADLGERAMLGDCGAGTLGALLGWAAAAGGTRARRVALAGGLLWLTAASERLSFSAVIERRRWLRALDGLGRSRR